MKERPILFSGAMVRALLAGTKTQTRRVLHPAPVERDGQWFFHRRGLPVYLRGAPLAQDACPYGQPGDRLWVREAWRSGRLTDRFPPREMTPHHVWYEADGQAPEACNGKLRPAMFMPRWASRITLEVVGVRVERLQDISMSDSWAEGIPGAPPPGVHIERVDEWVRWSDGVMREDPKLAYRDLWEEINGHGSWAANPWVWVVSFRRIEV